MDSGADCDYIQLEEGGSNSISASISPPSGPIDDQDAERQSPILIEVEAPATLAEGYTFWATTSASCDSDETHSCDSSSSRRYSQSITFPVRVPIGGVSAGETILAPLLAHRLEEGSSFCATGNDDLVDSFYSDDLDQSNKSQGSAKSNDEPEPTETTNGKWKQGICSCFHQGIFSRDLWYALLCPQILLGRILVRTDLVWLANPENYNGQRSNQDSSKASCLLRWAFRILFCLLALVECSAFYFWHVNKRDESMAVSALALQVFWLQELFCFLLSLPMSIWMLVVLVRLRRAIRERFQISTTRIPMLCCHLSLGGFEDIACALCCSCCMLNQMARQTSDLEGTESSSYITMTGLLLGQIPNEPKEKPQANQEGTDEFNSSKNVWGWWRSRKSSESKSESPLVGAPLSPSHSTGSNDSTLRYRLLSSPSSAC